eukprot:15369327-Alexandrium_andersonii.AAC.1
MDEPLDCVDPARELPDSQDAWLAPPTVPRHSASEKGDCAPTQRPASGAARPRSRKLGCFLGEGGHLHVVHRDTGEPRDLVGRRAAPLRAIA